MSMLHFELTPGPGKRAQIEAQLRDAVRAGRFQPGLALPPTRVLAQDLGVSRGTVMDAYAQLVAEGYLEARQGSATRVAMSASALPELPDDGRSPALRYDLRAGIPDASSFPRRAWNSAVATSLRELTDTDLVSPHRGGYAPLRRALVGYLAAARQTSAEVEHVIVTAGVAHGLSVVLDVLGHRGVRRVAVEDPSWPPHGQAVRQAGLEVVSVPVDEDGLDVDALERSGAEAVIVAPCHQFPTGVVLAPERRASLVAWARRHDAVIIEDDYDAEYRYDRLPVPALQGDAPDCVIYLGTASKMLIPTLRAAWGLVPPALADAVLHRNSRSRAWPSIIEQAALANLIDRGALQRHVRLLTRRYRARRDALTGALDDRLDVRLGGTAAGLHVVAWLDGDVDERAVLDQARAAGIRLHGVHRHCAVVQPLPAGLLMGYGMHAESGLREAIRQLADLPALAPLRREAQAAPPGRAAA